MHSETFQSPERVGGGSQKDKTEKNHHQNPNNTQHYEAFNGTPNVFNWEVKFLEFLQEENILQI